MKIFILIDYFDNVNGDVVGGYFYTDKKSAKKAEDRYFYGECDGEACTEIEEIDVPESAVDANCVLYNGRVLTASPINNGGF